MMTGNHLLNIRHRFDDSSLNDQKNQALQPPIYTQCSGFFPPDNPQQVQQDQYFKTGQTSVFNGLGEPCIQLPQAAPPLSDMDSFGLSVPNYGDTHHGGHYYDFANSQNTDTFYHNTSGDVACPRSWPHPYDARMTEGLYLSEAALQSQLHDPQYSHQNLSAGTGDSGNFYNKQKTVSRTPSLPDAVSCEAEDEAEDDSTSNTEENKTEEPYAKLIHRALMGAPFHSMALQEIYQWFIDNTDKGSSPGSGWRNSIRHNLSMNAAFRKTDRTTTSSSDPPPKKTSEWVLEPWAITDGVTPTTRYRKSTSKKPTRLDSHAIINASRQNAGKKGGNMASRTKTLRMAQGRGQGFDLDGQVVGAREAERDRDARRERKRCHQLRGKATTPQEEMEQRPFSPTTPTAIAGMNVVNPYYIKASPFAEAMGVSMYDMSHVQGVYTGDDGPVFIHDGLPRLDNEGVWPGTQGC